MARGGTGGTPRPDIHSISRAGQELYREKVRSQGEMIIASGDTLYSYDLDLETLQGLVLTVEGGSTDAYQLLAMVLGLGDFCDEVGPFEGSKRQLGNYFHLGHGREPRSLQIFCGNGNFRFCLGEFCS